MTHQGPNYVAINAAIHRPVIAHRASPFLRGTMYALQLADAIISASAFRHGAIEADPIMRPFSHGGVSMMIVGFGAGDILRGILFRHTSAGTKNTMNAIQAASNVEGILQTLSWERRAQHAVAQISSDRAP